MSNLIWHLATGGIMITGIIIGVIVVWRMLEDRKSGFPAQDERTKKLNGKAAMYAFTIGNYFMLALLFANLLNQAFLDVSLLDMGYALITSTLVQILTFLILRWYFNRKSNF